MQQPREIRNVALLDLTGAGEAALEGVSRIVHVAAILVPESLLPRLSQIPLEHVAATVPIPDGGKVRVMSGQVAMSGEALAAPTSDGVNETLVIAGQLVITSPVTDTTRDVVVMGHVVAPEGSESGLGKALRRLSGEVTYYPYSAGSRVLVLQGGEMAGEALRSIPRQESDTLLILNNLILTSNPPEGSYGNVVVLGHVLTPRGTEGALYGRVTPLGGRIIACDAPPRVFEGSHRFGKGFFEMLDQPITLVIKGKCTLEDDVTIDIVRQKLRGLVLKGKMTAPREVLPALQVVALSLEGKLSADDADD